MKALVYHGAGKKSLEDRPKPALREATDAVVRMVGEYSGGMVRRLEIAQPNTFGLSLDYAVILLTTTVLVFIGARLYPRLAT